MSDTVIKVENLSKRYRIGAKKGYKTFRETLVDAARAPIGKLSRLFNRTSDLRPPTSDSIWALKDVSFEVKRGEVVGIIGRNGAGKSTLLKILSKITEPTSGRIELRGRVGSLLEVGTGFHPELTGHENIYLYGAILGMDRWEVTRKFDEIVAFAALDKFIDTPVKRYSSGMYMRLAFAVAAHMEPEILMIDEVLAVGDVEFQKKCLGKMDQVGKGGRSVLFVSHNMAAIQSLCRKSVLLNNGTVSLYDESEKVIQHYLFESCNVTKCVKLSDRKDRSGSGKVRIVDFKTFNTEDEEVELLHSGNDYYFQMKFFNKTESYLNNIVISLDFFDEKNNRILLFRTNFTNDNFVIPKDYCAINCRINKLPLANGMYRTSIFISHADVEILDYIMDASIIKVDGGDFFGTGSLGLPSHCKILYNAKWMNS